MDNLTKIKRSWNMSRIKSKNTKPEIIVRKLLSAKNIRYRLHNPNIPGKPDLSIIKYKTAIFVNGCYWHGHNCKRGNIPKTNKNYWNKKIQTNINRDQNNYAQLKKDKWKFFIIWECEIKIEKIITKKINSIFYHLKKFRK